MNTTYSNIGIGIDPGWKNLGLAIVGTDKEYENSPIILLHSATINPSLKGIVKTVDDIREAIDCFVGPYVSDDIKINMHMERYVAYANVKTAETENITMVTGALLYCLNNFNPEMVRALDWKMELVKTLHKLYNFDNPSTKLDKKFSLAASAACLGIKKDERTDHEADATCLASIGILRNRLKAKQNDAQYTK